MYDSEEELLHGRSRKSALNGGVSNEDVDTASFMDPSEASAVFRRAEKRTGQLLTVPVCYIYRPRHAERSRTLYTYPPSPTSDSEPSRQVPLSQRIQLMKAELAALEAEASDPANPQLNAEDTDAGQMIRDLVGVRGRLEKLSSRKEGRERLIELITMAQASGTLAPSPGTDLSGTAAGAQALPASDETAVLAEIDKRVGELEKLVGSSSAALDEVSERVHQTSASADER